MGGDIELFELKKSKNEYISYALFEAVKDKVSDFNLDEYNESVLLMRIAH